MDALIARLTRWWSGVPRPVVDVGVAGCVAVVVNIAIHLADEPTSRPVDVYAYLLGMTVGAVLLARRWCPLAVLLATAAVLFGYYAVGYPGIDPALPLAVALYGAAVAGYLGWCLWVAGFYAVAGVVVQGFRLGDPLLPVLYDTVQELALLSVVILLGEILRGRRVRLADARARLEQVEREREREAAQRVTEERLRIARDVHDIVGHSVAAVTLQAGFAYEVVDAQPSEAKSALEMVLRTARTAMADLKVTVGMLRSGDPDADSWAPAPRLADLPGLAELTEQLGLRTKLVIHGEHRPLPGVVEVSAYRIIQESLTNILRHANATCATVMVRHRPDDLTIEVIDDGDGPLDEGVRPPGYGMVGMTERVAALGGQLEVGPAPHGGFRVYAELPVDGAH